MRLDFYKDGKMAYYFIKDDEIREFFSKNHEVLKRVSSCLDTIKTKLYNIRRLIGSRYACIFTDGIIIESPISQASIDEEVHYFANHFRSHHSTSHQWLCCCVLYLLA